jgi:hypothetical protein
MSSDLIRALGVPAPPPERTIPKFILQPKWLFLQRFFVVNVCLVFGFFLRARVRGQQRHAARGKIPERRELLSLCTDDHATIIATASKGGGALLGLAHRSTT